MHDPLYTFSCRGFARILGVKGLLCWRRLVTIRRMHLLALLRGLLLMIGLSLLNLLRVLFLFLLYLVVIISLLHLNLLLVVIASLLRSFLIMLLLLILGVAILALSTSNLRLWDLILLLVPTHLIRVWSSGIL